MLTMKIRIIAIFWFAFLGQGNSVFAQELRSDWQKEVINIDSKYWSAYNNVDPKRMNSYLADDVEFYHDRGGTLIGKKALSDVNNGMLTEPNKIRRELIPGTMHVYPMRKGDELYGAMVTGEHQFYIIPMEKPEFLAGRSYFTHLMILNGDQWKIARIFSYEHVDASSEKK